MTNIPLQAVPGLEAPGTTSTTELDPFDPANLRLSQSFTETVGVKKLLTTVPVRKPGPQDFVRVHSAAEYRENFPIIELRDDREEYIVTNALVPELTGEFVTKTLSIDKTRLVKLINATQGAIEHERRRFRRVPVRSKVQLKMGAQHWLGETIDLSLDGMLVTGAGILPSGANVQVNLQLAPDIKPIEGAGSVVRVLTENRMGIQLNQLPLAESGRLQEFLLPLIFQASQRELSMHAPQTV